MPSELYVYATLCSSCQGAAVYMYCAVLSRLLCYRSGGCLLSDDCDTVAAINAQMQACLQLVVQHRHNRVVQLQLHADSSKH
jgi:hypothetical protein